MAGEVERVKATARAGYRLVRSHQDHPWPGFGQPFNGQAERTRTIESLVDRFEPGCCIETGTFFGHTSKRLAEFGVPVYTIERDPGLANVARLRLARRQNITVLRGDSATLLPSLAAKPDVREPFIYLDAHWGEGLPLVSELETIFSAWADCVVVIDDFRVPHDDSYGYDVYDEAELSLELLALPGDVTAGFPTLPAREETGGRRGTLYLGRGRGAQSVGALVDAGQLSAP
jgi:predicted O-methyltransferase YrrM